MSEVESEENETVLIFTTLILSSLWISYDYDFRFSRSRKRSYDSDYDPDFVYDSDSDFVTSIERL